MDSLELDEKLKDLTNEEIQYSIISNYRKSLDMEISVQSKSKLGKI